VPFGLVTSAPWANVVTISSPLRVPSAAARLGVSVRRVQQMVKNGQLPATVFGGALMIRAKDLKLAAERKPGRPPKIAKKKGE
jgi:excisionase family DNA binding protein